jgi:hypothetical protein
MVGDFFLDTQNNLLFGPYTATTTLGGTVYSWGTGQSLIGPQGPAGPVGPAYTPVRSISQYGIATNTALGNVTVGQLVRVEAIISTSSNNTGGMITCAVNGTNISGRVLEQSNIGMNISLSSNISCSLNTGETYKYVSFEFVVGTAGSLTASSSSGAINNVIVSIQ